MALTELDRIVINGTVTQYSYRRARVTDAFMVVARDERMDRLEAELVKAAGANRDNHVVYAISRDWRPGVVFDHIEVRGADKALYVWFHDFEVFFGNTIEVNRP